jgi:hypothetical protein
MRKVIIKTKFRGKKQEDEKLSTAPNVMVYNQITCIALIIVPTTGIESCDSAATIVGKNSKK